MIKKNALLLMAGLISLFVFTQPAHAIVQFRLSYGLGQPEGFDQNNVDYDTGEFGGDIIVSIPLVPFIFGLRYEKITSDFNNNSIQQEIDLGRISIVGGYRFIDTLAYAGAIGTFGIINDGEMTYKAASETVREIDMSNSLTLGFEGGVKLNGFLAGLELGYRYGKDKGQITDFEYSGVYAKALVGYEF